MKVGEIMTKEVHTIGPEQTLKECAEVLKKHRVNGLVVIYGGRKGCRSNHKSRHFQSNPAALS
ncbi:MAG: CBS domain-containing protein [Nitrospirota bacterium]